MSPRSYELFLQRKEVNSSFHLIEYYLVFCLVFTQTSKTCGLSANLANTLDCRLCINVLFFCLLLHASRERAKLRLGVQSEISFFLYLEALFNPTLMFPVITYVLGIGLTMMT